MPPAGKGSLDLTKYVALGNSATAGYADNALYNKAQLVAYPNLIAQQLRLAGGGDFRQPLVSPTSPGIGAQLNARYVLSPVTDCMGTMSLSPVHATAEGDMGIFLTSVAFDGPFQNMGIPGLKAPAALMQGYGNPQNGMQNFNPFFTRMTSNPASASVMSDVLSQQPTFFSLAIGNDDVLPYATSGGAADQITPAGGAGVSFSASVTAIVNNLTANGAKGAIANVPHINLLPFFTTIPYNGLALDQANAAGLTAAYGGAINFHEGYNPFVIQDANAPGGLRQIQEGEFILLTTPQDSLKCKGWGSVKPVPHQFVLTANEITEITEAITAYNVTLKTLADEKGLAFVDLNAYLNTVKSGILVNGRIINSQFVSGGAFSLDGLHFTALGNALVANQFIKAINAKYGSTIPQVNAGLYKGVSFP